MTQLPDDPREEAIEEYEDVDGDQVVDDAVEFFDAEDDSPPVGETEIPPPG